MRNLLKKTKHNPPKKKKGEKNFIPIYEELGIAEKIVQAPPGTFVIRKDFSGLDVLPIVAPKDEIVKPPGEPEKPGPEKETGEEPAKEKSH